MIGYILITPFDCYILQLVMKYTVPHATNMYNDCVNIFKNIKFKYTERYQAFSHTESKGYIDSEKEVKDKDLGERRPTAILILNF